MIKGRIEEEMNAAGEPAAVIRGRDHHQPCVSPVLVNISVECFEGRSSNVRPPWVCDARLHLLLLLQDSASWNRCFLISLYAPHPHRIVGALCFIEIRKYLWNCTELTVYRHKRSLSRADLENDFNWTDLNLLFWCSNLPSHLAHTLDLPFS